MTYIFIANLCFFLNLVKFKIDCFFGMQDMHLFLNQGSRWFYYRRQVMASLTLRALPMQKTRNIIHSLGPCVKKLSSIVQPFLSRIFPTIYPFSSPDPLLQLSYAGPAYGVRAVCNTWKKKIGMGRGMLARPAMGRPKPIQPAHINSFRPATSTPSSFSFNLQTSHLFFFTFSASSPSLPWIPSHKSLHYSTKPLGESSKSDRGNQEEQEGVHLPWRSVLPHLFPLL